MSGGRSVSEIKLPPPFLVRGDKKKLEIMTKTFKVEVSFLNKVLPGTDHEQFFRDGHGTENFELPIAAELAGSSYWIEQEYQWTAPWMSDPSGCPIWTTMLTDVVTRKILLVNGRWVCRITSNEAGTAPDFDIANVSIESTPRSGAPTPAPSITVKWIASGSVLQWSGTPHGPWNDVLESPSLTEMTFSSDDGAPSKFFRIKF